MPHWQLLGDRRGLREDLRDRVARLAAHRHEHPRHHREVERHVALVAAGRRVAEVVDDVLRPLVGLGQQHAVRVQPVDLGAHPLEELVRRGQVLAVGALRLVQVRHRVEPEAVDAQVQPEPQRLEDRVLHARVLVVQVRLVGEEPVPEVLLADRVEGPVRGLGVDEDDPRVRRTAGRRRPRRRSRRTGPSGSLRLAWNHGCWSEVWFMTKSMITRMPRSCAASTSSTKSPMVPNVGVHVGVVGDVVAAVAQRRA